MIMPLPTLPYCNCPSGVAPAGKVARPTTLAKILMRSELPLVSRPPAVSPPSTSRSDEGGSALLSLMVLAGPMMAESPVGLLKPASLLPLRRASTKTPLSALPTLATGALPSPTRLPATKLGRITDPVSMVMPSPRLPLTMLPGPMKLPQAVLVTRMPALLAGPPGPRPLGTADKPSWLRPTMLPETMLLTVLWPKISMPMPLLPDTTLPAITFGIATTVSAAFNDSARACTPAKDCGRVEMSEASCAPAGNEPGTGMVPLTEMPVPLLASLALEPEVAPGLVPTRLPVTV